MKLQYYEETDSLYIDLSEKTSADSREIAPGVVLDFDAEGALVGIDIDRASTVVRMDRLDASAANLCQARRHVPCSDGDVHLQTPAALTLATRLCRFRSTLTGEDVMRVPATIVVFVVLACTVNAQWRYRDPAAPRLRDGTIDIKAPPPRTPSGTVDLSGLWQTDVKYNFNLGADLKPDAIVMLPWAQALYDERRDNNGKDDPEGFCMPPGFPRVNGVPFPQKIIQLPTSIVILYETRTTFRQIFLDSNHTLTAEPQPTWMGYSKGRWDGDTLVVETTGFNDKTWLDDAGHPHSEQMKVTERFR